MKILIGTPIHQVKDYAMWHWLKNVRMLEYPADVFLTGNSPTPDYVPKVKEYCRKLGIPLVTNLSRPVSKSGKNCKIEYWGRYTKGMQPQQRINYCEEVIRQKVLDKGYDAWFSWECDQLIPLDTLNKMIKLMQDSGASMVVHNSWARKNPTEYNLDMGVALIKREALEKAGPLYHKGKNWRGGLSWYKERVLKSGGNYIDAYGLIKPIYHLCVPVLAIFSYLQIAQ